MRFHLFLLVAAACSPAVPTSPSHPGSRGMRADAHLDAARDHARRAAELSRWPETRPDGTGVVNDPATGLWYRRFDTSNEHTRLAESHRAAAARLHVQYDEACGATPFAEVSVSPLQRFGRGGANTSDGVLVFLDPQAGPPDRLLAAIKCHRAWMMLGNSGMDDCPLDLADIHVVAHGDPEGISLEITTTDAKLVPELQRRAAKDLEHAAQIQKRADAR